MAQVVDPTAARPRPDPNLGILLRDPYLAFSAQVLHRLHRAGYEDLRAAHLVIFQHIDGDGSRITDLAARAQMTKPSIGYLVDHLERCGYVRREADPDDGRARIVRLTDRGWRQIDDALAILADLEDELAVALGSRRVATLRGLLSDVRATTEQWRA